MSERNLDDLASRLGPDTVFNFPKTESLVGAQRILRFFRILFRQSLRLDFELIEMLVDG